MIWNFPREMREIKYDVNLIFLGMQSKKTQLRIAFLQGRNYAMGAFSTKNAVISYWKIL